MNRRIAAASAASAVIVALAVPAFPASAHPAPSRADGRVVVAPHGSDSAAGTAAHPLRTVRAALHRLGRTGGTVLLRGGVYHQRVRLIHEHHITVRPYRDEHPVLSGAGM